jgi:hypothetical protein
MYENLTAHRRFANATLGARLFPPDAVQLHLMNEQPALGIYLLANMEGMEGGAEHTRIV